MTYGAKMVYIKPNKRYSALLEVIGLAPTIGAVNFSSTNTGNKHEEKQEKCQSKNE
jgi:hypothetical protein